MKSAIALFFTFIFSTTFISVSYVSNADVMAKYLLHKKEITAKYCVNKDKPQLHCQGKCFLRKQLKKGHHREKKTGNIFQRLDIHLICAQLSDFSFHNFFEDSISFPPFQKPKINNPLSSIFHPPIFT